MNVSNVDYIYSPTALRNGTRKHALGVLGYVVTMSILLFIVGCDKTPHYTSDVLKLMSKYGTQGRYDDAIKVGRDWEQKFPDDSSTNAFLDQQIALLYLRKASDDSAHKEQWISRAISSSEEGLSSHGNKDWMNLTLGAAVFESAGDQSNSGRCVYYQKSIALLQDLIPLEGGDNMIGSRTKDRATLSRVMEKAEQTGCGAVASASSSPQCPDPRLRQAKIVSDTFTGSATLQRKPLKFARMRLYSSSGKIAWNGTTDKNGGFIIKKMSPGNYRLDVNGWGSTSVKLSEDVTPHGAYRQKSYWNLALIDNACVFTVATTH